MRIAFDTPQGLSVAITASPFTGRETVTVNGHVISSKTSYLYLTPHSFVRSEDGQQVVYELNVITGFLGSRPGYILRRNGIVVAHT
jgi:hypothetical protein